MQLWLHNRRNVFLSSLKLRHAWSQFQLMSSSVQQFAKCEDVSRIDLRLTEITWYISITPKGHWIKGTLLNQGVCSVKRRKKWHQFQLWSVLKVRTASCSTCTAKPDLKLLFTSNPSPMCEKYVRQSWNITVLWPLFPQFFFFFFWGAGLVEDPQVVLGLAAGWGLPTCQHTMTILCGTSLKLQDQKQFNFRQ